MSAGVSHLLDSAWGSRSADPRGSFDTTTCISSRICPRSDSSLKFNNLDLDLLRLHSSPHPTLRDLIGTHIHFTTTILLSSSFLPSFTSPPCKSTPSWKNILQLRTTTIKSPANQPKTLLTRPDRETSLGEIEVGAGVQGVFGQHGWVYEFAGESER
jgi:hypothetical protein